MVREALVSALLLALVACGETAASSSQKPAPAATSGEGGTPAEPPIADADALPDVLPLSIKLDCAKLGDSEPPWTVYVKITLPINQGQPELVGRIDGDPCAEHDVAVDAEAPALALRCPARGIMQYDTSCYTTFYDISVTVCSPGFEPLSTNLSNFGGCPVTKRQARPSCDELGRLETGAYPYHSIVYETVPTADGSNHCFGKSPEVLFEDQELFECPCSQGTQR